jgi:putative lipoprotein
LILITHKIGLAAMLVALLAFTFMEGNAMADLATITGTASYRERIALKPGAVLEVELLDISRADAPSQRLASIRIRAAGQVPIPFTLTYDPTLIETNHTYSVSAKLLIDSEVVFRTDTVHPVLTRGAGDTVDVQMVKAASHKARNQVQPAVLTGPTWVAEDIDGQGVVDTPESTITFTADGSAHGSGGCNRFRGSYTVEGEKLTIGPLAGTRRACLPAIMEQEDRFHAALGRTRGYRIDKGLLFLIDDQGAPTMRLRRQD